MISAVQPMFTKLSSFVRTMPNGRFWSTHSITISLYRGSKCAEAGGRREAAPDPAGKAATRAQSRDFHWKILAGRSVDCTPRLDLIGSAGLQTRHGNFRQSRGDYGWIHGDW